MNERLQWNEIQDRYPDQWIGLSDVEWDGSTVISAIVKYTDRSRGELTRMQIRDNNLYSCYTHPDHLAPLGMVGYQIAIFQDWRFDLSRTPGDSLSD